ncbi:MAG TPA: hypothetical protein PLI95_18470 [Polyangiaceae bacterium]|nr:hypothetical protein [Polyangiaceae bacterium]
MDPYPVTREAYWDFVASRYVTLTDKTHTWDMTDQAAVCSLNTEIGFPSGDGESVGLPFQYRAATGLDWCDAYLYCKSAGKRMCGRIGGGSTPYSAFGGEASILAGVDQWVQVCTSNAAYPYATGTNFSPDMCVNGLAYPDTTCHSPNDPWSAVHWMHAFNEWTDSCDGGECVMHPRLTDTASNCVKGTLLHAPHNAALGSIRCCSDP